MVEILWMKYDQYLCLNFDMNSTLGPVVPFQYCTAAGTLRLVSHSQGNKMNIMNVTSVMCSFQLYLYFLDLSISFIFHVSFTFNDIMTIMLLQSPTLKFHYNIICQHIECLCHQHSLQFQKMCAVLSTFHYILLYFLNLI